MQTAPGLNDLHDIVEGSPVPWWPPAAGWWVLGALALFAGCMAAWRTWQRWTAGAYRRAALQELETATTVEAVTAILKRTALSAWPRSDVASLTGTAWCDWLRQTGGTELSSAVAETLCRGAYQSEQTALAPLAEFARGWILAHRLQDSAAHSPAGGTPGTSASTEAPAC